MIADGKGAAEVLVLKGEVEAARARPPTRKRFCSAPRNRAASRRRASAM